MPTEARVSVVIPAYNAERFLAAAIESVLSQSCQSFEVVVVDDGSTDGTGRLAESYGPPVRCLRQENRGLSEARNRGIRESAGELVALLDADDTWAPTKLAEQVALMDGQPGLVACFTRTRYVDEDGRLLRESTVPAHRDLVEALLLYSCVIGPPSAAVIRRSSLDRVGLFDPRFSQCADWDMWLRLAELGPVGYVDEPLVDYRVHGASMSRNSRLLEADTLGVLDKFFTGNRDPRYAALRRRAYGNHWMILSGSHLHAGRWRDSLRCLARALALNPSQITRPLGLPYRWLKRKRPSRPAEP